MPEAHQTFEQEIAELERALTAKKALLEQQRAGGNIAEIPHARELIAEHIKERLAPTPGIQQQQHTTQPQPAQPQPATQPPASSATVPSYDTEELHGQVQKLIDLAFGKSLNEAIDAAKATDNPALIDAFHDVLADELYGHLVETGKLPKV